jgi:opacity protein-like surface antigen
MSKYLVRSLTAAGALLACVVPACALAAQPGFYLGGGVGMYALEIDELDYDDDAALLRGFGGFRLSDHWAIEADYQYFQESEDRVLGQDVKLDFKALTLSVRPIIPLGSAIDLYARAGWTWYDAEASVPGFGAVDGSDDDFTWGGGVDFHLGDLLTLRGDISRVEIEDSDLNLISAAVILRF